MKKFEFCDEKETKNIAKLKKTGNVIVYFVVDAVLQNICSRQQCFTECVFVALSSGNRSFIVFSIQPNSIHAVLPVSICVYYNKILQFLNRFGWTFDFEWRQNKMIYRIKNVRLFLNCTDRNISVT